MTLGRIKYIYVTGGCHTSRSDNRSTEGRNISQMSEPFHHRPTLKQVGLCLAVMQASLDFLRLDKQAI